MDELKDKYEDLNNLVDNLKMAANECNDIDYKEQVLGLMRQVQEDIESIESLIYKQEQLENKELINDLERSRLC